MSSSSSSSSGGGGSSALLSSVTEYMLTDFGQHSAADAAPSSTTMAMAMLFGSIGFCTAAMATRSFLTGDHRPLLLKQQQQQQRQEDNVDVDVDTTTTTTTTTSHRPTTTTTTNSLDLSRFESIYTLFHQLSILGWILAYAYLCEHHPLYAHSTKSMYDRDEFLFYLIIVVLASISTTWKRNDAPTTPTNSSSMPTTTTRPRRSKSSSRPSPKSSGGNSRGGDGASKSSGTTISGSRRSRHHHHHYSAGSKASSTAGSAGRMLAVLEEPYEEGGGEEEEEPLVPSPTTTNDNDDVLNRHQTDEWKGWMQVVLLLYEYFVHDTPPPGGGGGSDYSTMGHHHNEVYHVVRVLISCYVWLTGYGHLSYFYITGDYSVVRILHVLWRLNVLVFFLCWTQGSTTYIFYHACLLHTYYFFMVYIVMKLRSNANHDTSHHDGACSFGGVGRCLSWLRIKLGLLAILIALVWDIPHHDHEQQQSVLFPYSLFEILHFPFFGNYEMVGAIHGSLWEWYYQSSLDHWSTLLGMIFAMNLPITCLLFRKLEPASASNGGGGPSSSSLLFQDGNHTSNSNKNLLWNTLAKASMGLGLTVAFVVWYLGPYQQQQQQQHTSKMQYDRSHAYFCFIPILVYVFWRNCHPYLRSHHVGLFQQMGKTTLETYLLHSHIWLTSNSKTVLTLIPGWPKVNFVIVTIIFLGCSRTLFSVTSYLRDIVLPSSNSSQNNLHVLGRNLGIMVGIMVVHWALAWALSIFGVLNLMTVGIVSTTCGILLYQSILDQTWNRYKNEVLAAREVTVEDTLLDKMMGRVGASHPNFDSWLAQLVPPIVGAMVILVTGLIWHGLAQVGGAYHAVANPLLPPPLPAGCDAFVNDGMWVPVQPCQDETQAAAIRDYGVMEFATCDHHHSASSYTWSWNATHPGTHCRFVHRSPKSLRAQLQGRSLTFIGDSITRHIYHAELRALGMAGAGAYNTKVPKWSNIFNTVGGDVTMEFEWAALAQDQIVKLRDIIKRPKRRRSSTMTTDGDGSSRQAADAMDSDKSFRPDLIVMGGGAWDRLHVYATDEDRESHRATVKELAKEIRLARSDGIPVVWIVPTTINSIALQTEEKKRNIKEDDMAGMRTLYAQLGVLSSASFVLDGPSFTEERVGESFDGVHYPLSVYDAGAQILSNAIDWLMIPFEVDADTVVMVASHPDIGSLANPPLALMILCFVVMGLVCFDGFLGFSYLASFFAGGVMPTELHDEALDEFHKRRNIRGSSRNRYLPLTSSLASTMTTSRSITSGMASGGGGGANSTMAVDDGSSRISGRTSRSGRSRGGASGRSGGRSSTGSAASVVSESTASSQASIENDITALLSTTSRRLEMRELR